MVPPAPGLATFLIAAELGADRLVRSLSLVLSVAARSKERTTSRSDGDLACSGGSSPDSPLEGTGFEPSVPPKKRRPSREAPRPTIVVSRDDLCLMTPSHRSIGLVSLVGNSRETFHKSGTDGSNSVPPSGESSKPRRQMYGVGSGGQAGPTARVLTSERRSAFGSDCLPYGKTPYRRLACRAAE